MLEALTNPSKFNALSRKTTLRNRVVDSDLIGDWVAGSGAKIRIAPDGWYYLTSDPYAYEISQDGSILTFTGSVPVTAYQRVYGSGQQLIGVWTLTIQDGHDVYVEELTYRNDGTYSSHWTLNGVFESDWFGNYINQTTHIKSEERRALLSTGSPDTIIFDVPYGADFSGTYSKANADNFSITIGATTTNYARI